MDFIPNFLGLLTMKKYRRRPAILFDHPATIPSSLAPFLSSNQSHIVVHMLIGSFYVESNT